MKPFDLEAFKKGAVAVTRGGQEAYFIAVCPEMLKHQQLVFGYGVESARFIGTKNLDGLGCNHRDTCHVDLVGMKPTKKTYWTNLYKSSYKSPIGDGGFFLSEQRAKEKIKFPDQYIGTYPVEIEE